MTLTNVVRTIFVHLRNGQKIVRTTFVRVIVTKPLAIVSETIFRMPQLNGNSLQSVSKACNK